MKLETGGSRLALATRVHRQRCGAGMRYWSRARRWRGLSLYIIGLVLFICVPAGAASPSEAFTLPASDRIEVGGFGAHVALLEDPRGELTLEQVRSASFTPATLKTVNIGFSDSVWWVRFALRNPGGADREVFLRQDYPLIDYLDLHLPAAGGGYVQRSAGDRRPFAARDIAHRDLIFALEVPAASERVFYLRYQSQGPIDISLSLYDSGALLEDLSREQTAYGIYFGCVIMLLVWAGLVFIAVRDKAFLAYFAYVAAFGLYMLVNNGLAYQYLWPESPRWGNTSLIVLISLSLMAGLQFSRMILRARDYIPKLDRLAQLLQLAALLALAATPVLPYSTLIAPVAFLILISVIFMLILGLVSMLSGSRPAKFYVLAWGSFLAGSVFYLLKVFGVLPHTFFTQNGWQIGSLLEMILLSMTLSSRMHELQHEIRTDPLTLLGNRRLFDDTLAREFALARSLRRPLSLLVLDIDRFKSYNDRHGHAAGDEAIKIVASALRKQVRKPYTACRYGGEEFAVVLPSTTAEGAQRLAERIRTTVESALEGERAITVSVGFACLSPAHFASAERLFEAADHALYAAKAQGRNRVAAFRGRRDEDPQDEVPAGRAANL